jgi:transposase
LVSTCSNSSINLIIFPYLAFFHLGAPNWDFCPDFWDINVTLYSCWVHARRKFVEVTKAVSRKTQTPVGNAATALKYIGKLYKIEKAARADLLSPRELYEKRQKEVAPILEEFKKWLDATVEKVPPKSLLGKAVNYTLNEWDRLIRYIEDGRVGPDNNAVENAIRPFVVGRNYA